MQGTLIEDVVSALPRLTIAAVEPIPPPPYSYSDEYTSKIALAVESMKRHTSDEGWQLMQALNVGGFTLCGHGLMAGTNVANIIKEFNPHTVVVQDKREWDVRNPNKRDYRDPDARFTYIEALASAPDIFKAVIVKDVQQAQRYYRYASEEVGCHAWITYYHPRIVQHLAPYMRPQHTIRTYHSIDPSVVVPYDAEGRSGAILSGSLMGNYYPLRERLAREISSLHGVVHHQHPGYCIHPNGAATPAFLKRLASFRVAICTASKYGFALRKIIEATAAGCRVITDLPIDEVLPEIDENLIRIRPDISIADLNSVIDDALHSYSPEIQSWYADKCLCYYNYKRLGIQLASDIEEMRRTYK
jgi:hypothetical protein